MTFEPGDDIDPDSGVPGLTNGIGCSRWGGINKWGGG